MPKERDGKVNEYPTWLRPDLRLQNYILSDDNGDIIFFAISLIYTHEGKDYAVVRYDNEGGTVHRDLLHPDGSYLDHRKKVRFGLDLHAAIRTARNELAQNCETYVSDFLTCL